MKKIIVSLLALSLMTASLMAGCTAPEIEIPTDDTQAEASEGTTNTEQTEISVPDVILTEEDGISVMNVGGKDVSKAELRYWLSNLKLQNAGATDEEIKESTLNYIKDEVAISLLASQIGVEFDQAATDYLNETIAYTIEQCNSQEGFSYEQALAESYMTDTVCRDRTALSILASLLYSEYATEGGSKYEAASSSEIVDAIKATHVRVKHVLIKTDELESEEEREDARVLADDILARAQAGENFEELVTEYSADGMDVEKGYYFTTGVMVPEFETASFMLSVGDVAMVESTYGYHIIKKYEMLEEHILADESLLQAAEGSIYSAKVTEDLTEIKEAVEYTLNDNYDAVAEEILSSVTAG